MPAFEHAIEVGADVIELDLAVTKDDVLVVSHDPIINKNICSGEHAGKVIRTLTLQQVKTVDCGGSDPAFVKQNAIPGTRIPTFDEVLALGKRDPKIWFNIETKLSIKRPEYTPEPEQFSRMILDAVRKHKLEDRVILQSFDFRTLHAMKKLDPKIPLAALYMGPAKDFVEIAKEAGAGTVAPHFSLVTPAQVEAAHKAGLKVVPWTANSPEVWKKLVDAKVDAIITDDPAELISFLKQ